MPKDDSTEQIRVIKANYVEVPMTDSGNGRTESPEIYEARQAFFRGEHLTPEQLRRVMVVAAEGGGNGNCHIC